MKTRNCSKKVIRRRTRSKGYYKGGIYITNNTDLFGKTQGLKELENYEKGKGLYEIAYDKHNFVEILALRMPIMKKMTSEDLNTYLNFYVKLLNIIINYFNKNKDKNNVVLKQYYKFFNDVYIKTLLDIKEADNNNENKITDKNKNLMLSLYEKFNGLDKNIHFKQAKHNPKIVDSYENLINPLGQSLKADSSESSDSKASTVDANIDDEHDFQIKQTEEGLIDWLKNTKKSSRRV